MAIISVLSLIMIAVTAGYLLKVSLSDMLPFVWSGLVLVLYPLAFIRSLSTIDYILPAVAVILTVLAVHINKSRQGRIRDYLTAELTSIPVIVYVLTALVISLCVSDKAVTWWDDINFWASDVKSIYFLDGFASKYANVSPEFGDYPPGIQLAKWFVLHLNRHEFSEGLAFIGYYLFNFSFLMPLFKRVRMQKRNVCFIPLLVIAVWLFSGTTDKFGYAGFCADLSMAFVFGGILIAGFDSHDGSEIFDWLRMGFYLAVLVLIKSTGSLWAIFGIIIWLGNYLLNVTDVTLKKAVRKCLFLIFPLAYGGSWLLFCLKMHRVTKTTSTMITYITTDRYGLSEYTGQFALAFVRAFFTEPIHVDRAGIIIPPFFMLAAIIAILVLFLKKGYIQGRGGRFTAVALPVSGVLYYVAIFIAHITIFATETQYLESSAMIASIERYGLPFMTGSLMLISWVWLGNNNSMDMAPKQMTLHLMVFTVCILLLTDIPAAYDGIWGYRSHMEEDLADRQEFMDSEAEAFTSLLSEKLPGADTRVCRLHDGGYYRVADTYVNYEASPVSVMDISYDLSQIGDGELIQAVSQTHAVYLYADQQAAIPDWLDDMADNGKFNCGKLYYISYEDGGMKLYEQ